MRQSTYSIDCRRCLLAYCKWNGAFWPVYLEETLHVQPWCALWSVQKESVDSCADMHMYNCTCYDYSKTFKQAHPQDTCHTIVLTHEHTYTCSAEHVIVHAASEADQKLMSLWLADVINNYCYCSPPVIICILTLDVSVTIRETCKRRL